MPRGITAFDQPAQAQFVNTYVPIPFQEILQAGQTRQQAYQQNLAAFEQAQAEAEQIPYIPSSIDEQYIRGTVLPTFEELADEFSTQDFSDPNVVRSLNKRIRNLDRQRISRIRQSSEAYKQYQKDLRQLGLQGRSASFLNQFNPKTFSSEFGIFDEIVEARLPFEKTAESYFNQLRDSSIDFDPDTGRIVSGVTSNDIKHVAQANLSEFMSLPDGRQAISSMRSLGMQGTDAQLALDYLYSRGQEFIRNSIGFAPKHATSAGKKEEQLPGGTVYGKGISMLGHGPSRKDLRRGVKELEDLVDFQTTYVTKEGEPATTFQIIDEKLFGWVRKWDDSANPEDALVKKISLSDKAEEGQDFSDSDVYNNIISRARNYHTPNVFDSKTLKQQKKLVNSYLEDYQTRSQEPAMNELTDMDSTELFNKLFLAKDSKTGNILAHDRTWYDPSSTIDKKVDYNTITEKYDPEEYEYFISHELKPQNTVFSSGYSVVILKDKKPVDQLYMSGSEEEMDANRFEHDLHKAITANPSGLFKVDDNDPQTDMTLLGKMDSDYSGQFVLRVGDVKIPMSIDNTVVKQPITADQILEQVFQNLAVYNTNFNQ